MSFSEGNKRQDNLIRDSVTGLLTHSQFLDFLGAEMESSRESDASGSLLLVNPDGFAAVNNTHGYEAGDIALRRIGKIMQDTLRDFDISALFEGTTFAAYLAGANADHAGSVAERIRHAVAQADIHGLTVSIGIASSPKDGNVALELVGNARAALFQAKMQGGNRVSSNTSVVVATDERRSRILIVDDDKKKPQNFEGVDRTARIRHDSAFERGGNVRLSKSGVC